MTAIPPLSVVMPVNDGRFLEPCIASLEAQRFADFEVVVTMNGLRPEWTALLHEWARRDTRVALHEGLGRGGLVESANEVTAHARAPLVARMDADDVAHPDRLRRQTQVFRECRDVVLVGVLSDGIDADGRPVRPRDRARLLRRHVFSPFPHGSAMFLRDAFERVGGYRAASQGWEDLDLFVRLGSTGRVFVVPEALYHYRYHSSSATMRRSPASEADAMARRQRCLAAYGPEVSSDEVLGTAGRVDPAPDAVAAASVGQAAYCIWAGERPRGRLEVGGLLRRGSVRLAGRSALYATWGTVSPVSLRVVLASWIRLRDRLASRQTGEEPFEWHFASS